MKTVILLVVVVLAGCSSVSNQYGTSGSFLFPNWRITGYTDPAKPVDPGQIAFRHGGRLDESAAVLSAATIADPSARQEATDALVEINKDRAESGWGYGHGWGGGYGGSGFDGRQNIQNGYIVNRLSYPVRIEISQLQLLEAGPGGVKQAGSITIGPRTALSFNLFPGNYEFLAINIQNGKTIHRAQAEIDWDKRDVSVRLPPDYSVRLRTDWFWEIK